MADVHRAIYQGPSTLTPDTAMVVLAAMVGHSADALGEIVRVRNSLENLWADHAMAAVRNAAATLRLKY